MTTADRIKNRRTELNMTQEDLARKMDLQDRSSVTRIEKSGNKISMKTLIRVADALKCSPAFLLGLTTDTDENIKIEPTIFYTAALLSDEQDKDDQFFPIRKNNLPRGTTKVVTGKPQDAKVEVKSAFTAVGSGHDAMPAKVTGVEVIDASHRIRTGQPKKQIPKPVLNSREELIKKILTLPDDLIDEIADYIDYKISKTEGGE